MINKDRLTAFTDAIAAIAATIMVLELGIPKSEGWAGFLAQKNVLMAYVVSYMMIYLSWYTHDNLLSKAEVFTPKAFLINGIWLLFLTLVPFTTAWVGKAGKSSAPRVLYTLNLLLWSMAFHWLEHRVWKDNPDISFDTSYRFIDRTILYVGFGICFALSFLFRSTVVPLIGVISIILIARIWNKRGTTK